MPGSDSIAAQRAAALANPITTAAIFLRTAADNTTKVCALYLDPLASTGTVVGAQTLRFRIHAWGTAVTSVTSNFQAILYYGVSTTAASNTALITLTNRSYVSTSGQWNIDGDFMWDNRTQKVSQYLQPTTFNLTTAETAALSQPLTAVDMTLGNQGFCVGALFGTTGAGNIAYMDGFVLEVV